MGIVPGTVMRLEKGCWGHKTWGGMWHFRRGGNQAGLTVCGIVIEMSGKGWGVWEEVELAPAMFGRLCAGCRGPLVGLVAEDGGGQQLTLL